MMLGFDAVRQEKCDSYRRRRYSSIFFKRTVIAPCQIGESDAHGAQHVATGGKKLNAHDGIVGIRTAIASQSGHRKKSSCYWEVVI